MEKRITENRVGVFPNRRSMDKLFFKPHELAARDHKKEQGAIFKHQLFRFIILNFLTTQSRNAPVLSNDP